jgi:biopolymer transport protein ExbD
MTPLVDVAFLLLTFFMFATTLAQPQTIEMSVPPFFVCFPVEVPASRLWNLYVRKDGKLFYNSGVDPILRTMKVEQLKSVAIERNSEQGNDLVTTLRVDPKAKYSSLITVLDRLNLAEANLEQRYRQNNRERERRFTIVNMTDEEKQRLELLP